MSSTETDLLHRITEFRIDGLETPALPFAARLAREHGWSRKYAERVIVEYKRYVFLAITGSMPVCPSEDVDAAWHLHLTYTRSYWKHFCTDVLGKPLHHEPTRGGSNEDDKHHRMYADTLAAYRKAFGENPPVDIWPPSDVRFGDDLKQRMVNTARNWIIPKSAVKRLIAGSVAAFLATVLIPGCDGDINPFQLKGAEFLGFLIPAIIAAAIFGRVLRSMLRSPGPMPQDDEVTLDWQQAAFVSGGEARLASAAVTRLYDRGVLRVSNDHTFLEQSNKKPESMTPVEDTVWEMLPLKNDPAGMRKLTSAAKLVYADEAKRLTDEGFTLSLGRDSAIGCFAMLPLLAVMLGFAVPRLIMGINNNKNVGFLVVTIIVGGLLGMAVAAGGRKRTTRRADAILARMRTTHAPLKAGQGVEADNAALAVALFGTAVLAGTGMAALSTWYPHLTSTSSSGCSSGCGTSSSSGSDGGGSDGSGGGCGGCGGGGCGGGGGD